MIMGNINHFKLYELIKAQQPQEIRQPVLKINAHNFFVHNRQPFSIYIALYSHEHQKNIIHTLTCMILVLSRYDCNCTFCTHEKKKFCSLFPFFALLMQKKKNNEKNYLCIKNCCRHKNVQLEWDEEERARWQNGECIKSHGNNIWAVKSKQCKNAWSANQGHFMHFGCYLKKALAVHTCKRKKATKQLLKNFFFNFLKLLGVRHAIKNESEECTLVLQFQEYFFASSFAFYCAPFLCWLFRRPWSSRQFFRFIILAGWRSLLIGRFLQMVQ